MKKYKSSDLTHKRAEVLKEANTNGAIIQQLETNGNVRRQFVILNIEDYKDLMRGIAELNTTLLNNKAT